jgi:hypothetical protein
MKFSDPSHKKILGILFIVFNVMGLMGVFFIDVFIDLFFDITRSQGESVPQEAMVVKDLISNVFWGIAIVFLIPKIIIGIGLVNQRKWANLPSMVYGILGLVNFPVGTLVGVYSILIYMAKPEEEERIQE